MTIKAFLKSKMFGISLSFTVVLVIIKTAKYGYAFGQWLSN